MKRFQLLVLVSALTAGAIWYGFYRARHTSTVAVASLLPRETLALIHLPDLSQSRTEWHRTDLYQLLQEPAVQDFLTKPKSRIPAQDELGKTVEEIETLGMKDAFVALVSLEYSAWKIVAGFRCTGDADQAEKIVHHWKTKLLGHDSDLKHETVEYQGRQIHIDSAGLANLSTVRSGPWFFAANDIEVLKRLLDRAEGRNKDPQIALSADDVFLAASMHMPSSYSLLAFARPNRFLEKLTPAGDQPAGSRDRLGLLREIRSFCAATSFDGGKIRDTLFLGMPRVPDQDALTRASLSIGTADTFLYAASLLNLTKEMELGPQPSGTGWLGGLQQITGALSANGITLEEWQSAFGPELGVIGDWPANSQWPSLFLSLPVKDAAKAHKIVTTITANPDGPTWTQSDREGVHYFSSASNGNLFSFSPAIGLSDRMLIAGAEMSSVESAMKRGAKGASGLAASKKFQEAERIIPSPQQAFAYIDLALVYARFDTTLRPVLVMGAAFMPGIADNVDLGKMPGAEVILKHLSPIVMSQRYERDGYVAESVGPLPLYQTILGSIAAGTAAAGFSNRQIFDSSPPALSPAPATPAPTAASPSPTPVDSP
jgi:hypothetical protein